MVQINSYYNVLIVDVCPCSKKHLYWCRPGILISLASIVYSPSKPQTSSHSLWTTIQTLYKQNLNSSIKWKKIVKQNSMIKTIGLQRTKQYLATSWNRQDWWDSMYMLRT